MPSRKRTSPVLGADRPDSAEAVSNPTADDALAMAEEAEAEAAEAEAVAAAARARARAIRLRRAAAAAGAADTATADDSAPGAEATEATAGSAPAADDADAAAETDAAVAPEAADETDAAVEIDETDEADATDAADETDEAPDGDAEPATAVVRPRRKFGRQVPQPGWRPVARAVALAAAVLGIVGLLTVSGLMMWKHHQTVVDHRESAEFEAAARQGVVTLMSLNFDSAQEDIQRIIDNTTGQFRSDFEEQAENFAKVAEESKVVTEVTVKATAVETLADDANSGVVLVAAESKVTNAAGAKQEPRSWRLSVSLTRDGDQLKMSKVEFVP